MKNTELRIGNLLMWFNEVMPVDVNDLMNLGEAVPIPLDEEWLVKFGFEKTGLHFYKEDFFLIWNSVDEEFDFRYSNKGIGIAFVHTLQNLHHILTNEELTIK